MGYAHGGNLPCVTLPSGMSEVSYRMKTFEVELKRTSYITLFIEAESKDEAEDKAWQEVEHDRADINDANWEVSTITEMEGYK